MATAKDMDALLQSFVDGGLPGCGLKITKDDDVLYEGYFGYSDVEAKTPLTRKSVFRQASTSKLPLYVTLMILFERGKFRVTDPIYEFLPEWRTSSKVVQKPNGTVVIEPTKRPINFLDVLTMRCGLPYCNFPVQSTDITLNEMSKAMQPLWDKGHFTLREQLKAISAVPLAFEPGTHWMYGFASELAAGLVEAITGKSIDTALKDILFDPLEMNDTRSHFFGDIESRMVKLYARNEKNKLSPIRLDFEKTFLPGEENEAGWARLFSTVEDYSHLMQMLACGGMYKGQSIMGRKTIDLMRTNTLNEVQLQDYKEPYSMGYGYGYGVRTLMDKAAGSLNGSIGAFGWTGGYGSWCESDPSERVSFTYMHNLVPNDELYYHPRVRTVGNAMIR